MNANTQLHLFSSMNHISSQDYRLPKYEILTHTTPPDLPDDPCLTLKTPLPPLPLFPLTEGNRKGTVRQEEVSGGEGRGRGELQIADALSQQPFLPGIKGCISFLLPGENGGGGGETMQSRNVVKSRK